MAGRAPGSKPYGERRMIRRLQRCRRQHAIGRHFMLDFAMIALAVASFALAIGYVAVCDRL